MATTLTTYSKMFAHKAFEDELVNATATVNSDAFQMAMNSDFGIWIKASSVIGTPDLSVIIEQAPTEIAADFCQLEAGSIQMNISDEDPHCDEMLNVYLPYGRIQIIGGATNPADTIVTVIIFRKN